MAWCDDFQMFYMNIWCSVSCVLGIFMLAYSRFWQVYLWINSYKPLLPEVKALVISSGCCPDKAFSLDL